VHGSINGTRVLFLLGNAKGMPARYQGNNNIYLFKLKTTRLIRQNMTDTALAAGAFHYLALMQETKQRKSNQTMRLPTLLFG